MFLMITLAILLVAAIIVCAVSFSVPKTAGYVYDVPARTLTRAGSGVLLFLFLLLLVLNSVVSIGTKNLGVETFGGKPTGYLTNGYHLKAPWVKVTELTNAVQTDTYASDGYNGNQQGGATDTCIHVRIARQSTACVNVSIRWQAKASGIDYLFRNFKNNNAITDNLVLRDLQQAMNEEFVDYDALGIDKNGNSTNTPLSSATNSNNLSSLVTNVMRNDIGQWIDVQSVIIPLLNFDPATEDKIHQIQTQIAATRVAQQQLLTNEAQAEANKALAASVSNDPGVLESKCLDILKEAVDKGLSLPAGFSCFGNGSQVAIATK